MNNDNPAEMSNADLEEDMKRKTAEVAGKDGEENVSKSTAAEGKIKTPEEDESSVANTPTFGESNKQDLNKPGGEGDQHNGNMPDPEAISNWEEREVDNDKMSG